MSSRAHWCEVGWECSQQLEIARAPSITVSYPRYAALAPGLAPASTSNTLLFSFSYVMREVFLSIPFNVLSYSNLPQCRAVKSCCPGQPGLQCCGSVCRDVACLTPLTLLAGRAQLGRSVLSIPGISDQSPVKLLEQLCCDTQPRCARRNVEADGEIHEFEFDKHFDIFILPAVRPVIPRIIDISSRARGLHYCRGGHHHRTGLGSCSPTSPLHCMVHIIYQNIHALEW